MKAREFLARRKLAVEERNLIKQPLSAAELRALAKKAGGAEQLVAPKRRAEAEGLSAEKLIAWLAEDGARVRRPIIEAGGELTLGFAADAQEGLERLLTWTMGRKVYWSGPRGTFRHMGLGGDDDRSKAGDRRGRITGGRRRHR